MPAIHASASGLLGACLTAFMRKSGRVLFSPKAIMAILFPLSFSAARRASIRYKIRKSITSAVDDMIYIHEKADPKTVLHMERETERLATGMSSVNKSLPRRSGASSDDRRAAQTVPPGVEPLHVQIEREAERIAIPTDTGAWATEPASNSASGEPNGPDSVRHAGTGRPSTLGKAGSMGPEQDPAGPPPRPARHLTACSSGVSAGSRQPCPAARTRCFPGSSAETVGT